MTSAFVLPIRRLQSELTWLQNEFLQAALSPKNRRDQLICEMTVVRLHDAWARFCRQLVISSALGRTFTLGGVPLSPCSASATRHSSVVPQLLATYPKRRFEPKWADATECIDAAQRLKINNLHTVSAALAATNSPADQIRRVRNFYAHRGRDTAHDAFTTNVFSTPFRPQVFDLAAYTTGGNRVIETWVNNLILVAMAAAQ
jgi:hypothetical protein